MCTSDITTVSKSSAGLRTSRESLSCYFLGADLSPCLHPELNQYDEIDSYNSTLSREWFGQLHNCCCAWVVLLCRYIGGSLTFDSLYQIDVITAFPNLVEIGGSLLVNECHSLHTLQLPSLQKVGGTITVNHYRQQRIRTYGFANTLQCRGGVNENACINCPSRWYGLSGCG